MRLEYYLNKLNSKDMPSFLEKYLFCPSITRLKHIGYFCGMDYASKDIYNFSEYITRFDHSLTVALLTYKLTKSKEMTLAGLFHDIATPCFSHVIDYMNEDYEIQESTEEFTEKIIRNDQCLKFCLEEDNLDINNIINFKQYPIVDNNRPKLCTDRIDGVILTGIGWTKNINYNDIDKIVSSLTIFKNEEDEQEIGFNSLDIAKKVVEVSKSIDMYCHSDEDNYMMQLLAKITRLSIEKGLISYEDLFIETEETLFNHFKNDNNQELQELLNIFENIKKEDIPSTQIEKVKVRTLHPLVNGKRIK